MHTSFACLPECPANKIGPLSSSVFCHIPCGHWDMRYSIPCGKLFLDCFLESTTWFFPHLSDCYDSFCAACFLKQSWDITVCTSRHISWSWIRQSKEYHHETTQVENLPWKTSWELKMFPDKATLVSPPHLQSDDLELMLSTAHISLQVMLAPLHIALPFY